MTLGRKLGPYRNWLVVALCVVILFFFLQFVLSLVVRHYANKAINSYPGLAGNIGSVSLHFIPGEYLIQNISLRYSENDNQEILNLEQVGVRIYWISLFKGVIEGDAWLKSPRLIIWAPKKVKSEKKTKTTDKKARQPDWQNQIRDLLPIKINTFNVVQGMVIYRDFDVKPPIELKIENISLEASNLTNRKGLKDETFAKTSVRAKVFESGEAELDMLFDPLAKHPTFNLQSAIRNIDLTKLNDFLLAYGKFDVDRGNFSLFCEIAAKNGKFVAYAKPVFHNIDVRAWESREHPNNKLLVLWKNIVGFVVDLLKNKEKDQLATKIKAEGTFDDPDLNVWEAVVSLLRNGFIQALIPGYDNSIDWKDVTDSKPNKKDGKALRPK